MTRHINSILINAARELVQRHIAGNRYRYSYETVALGPITSIRAPCGVEDTGEPLDPTSYETVADYLKQPAGPNHGILSLLDVLIEYLTDVAQRHGRKSAKAVFDFYEKLKHRPLGHLLDGDAEGDVAAREAKLRRRLKDLGYRLQKARTRNPFDFRYQTYTIIHRKTHGIEIAVPARLAGLERWVEEQLEAQKASVAV